MTIIAVFLLGFSAVYYLSRNSKLCISIVRTLAVPGFKPGTAG